MTREQAIDKLIETGKLSTSLLRPLGIGFESFLQFAQLPENQAEEVMGKLIKHFEKERQK